VDIGYSWLWVLSSFASEAGMRIKISFDNKIGKGSKEKRIPLEPWKLALSGNSFSSLPPEG
jgi:hypothetical protein